MSATYYTRRWPELANCTLVKGLDEQGRSKQGFCAGCGAALTGRRIVWCSDACMELVFGNHRWQYARAIVLREARNRCAFCGGWAYEVDHIEPARGRHGEFSCIHHRTNLRALCHRCHKARTAEQRATDASRARRARREAAEREGQRRREMQPRLAI